jgi:hypothetical protein
LFWKITIRISHIYFIICEVLPVFLYLEILMFNFSLSIFISKKFSAKFLEVDFETLQSILSLSM